jgi:hypothetical protein
MKRIMATLLAGSILLTACSDSASSSLTSRVSPPPPLSAAAVAAAAEVCDDFTAGRVEDPEEHVTAAAERAGIDRGEVRFAVLDECRQDFLDGKEALRAAGRREAPPPARWSSADLEFKLASIDAGHRNLDDADVKPYNRALNAAEGKCTEDRQLIGDMAVRATELAAGDGVEVSVLEMLTGMDEGVPPSAAPTECSGILAALIALLVANR